MVHHQTIILVGTDVAMQFKTDLFSRICIGKNDEQPTSVSMPAVFPKNGSGVGPEIPSLLNTVKGSTKYLEEKE